MIRSGSILFFHRPGDALYTSSSYKESPGHGRRGFVLGAQRVCYPLRMPHPLFADVIGHHVILDILSRTLAHPAPGYLFSGPDGVGKRMVAERFAKGLLGGAADASLDAHPDFIRLQREEEAKTLTVEQTRAFIQRMSLSAAMGGNKVAFVAEAERLNEESANALLKAVEEPSPGSVYLFITEEPERLPATLRSRLTPITFSRVSLPEIQAWMKQEALTQEREQVYLERADGSPGMIKRFVAEDAQWSEREKWARESWNALIEGPVGKSSGTLEQMTQSIEKKDDVEGEWRAILRLMMRECQRTFQDRPRESACLAHGLFHAWRLVGSSLSPRLALEWSAVQPYLIEEPFIPSFLQPSYL